MALSANGGTKKKKERYNPWGAWWKKYGPKPSRPASRWTQETKREPIILNPYPTLPSGQPDYGALYRAWLEQRRPPEQPSFSPWGSLYPYGFPWQARPAQPTAPVPPPSFGGGGGGAPSLPEPKFTIRDILEQLQFPEQWQYPSYLQDFGRYIEELLTRNPQFAVPVPEIEEGKLLPTPEDLDTLEYMETAESYAQAWNEFLQSLVNLPFFQQQYYLGLRYSPETGWYRSGTVPMLPHPEYL